MTITNVSEGGFPKTRSIYEKKNCSKNLTRILFENFSLTSNQHN